MSAQLFFGLALLQLREATGGENREHWKKTNIRTRLALTAGKGAVRHAPIADEQQLPARPLSLPFCYDYITLISCRRIT